MPVPKNINKEHVVKAIEEIDRFGVPDDRGSTKFSLLFNFKRYPPKYVISIANKYASGEELPPSEFSGGKESNSYLSELGFEIISNLEERSNHSWDILSPITAVKEMDKSSFLHKGTGIPMDIRVFFRIENMEKGEKRNTTLIYNDTQFQAHFVMDKVKNPRTRLLWSGDLAKAIQNDFPLEYEGFRDATLTKSTLNMWFKKYTNEYEVFINKKEINKSLQGEFDYTEFNRSFDNREYIKGIQETRYYILTVNNPGNINPPHQNIAYRIIVLENHKVIKEDYVYDRNRKNLLTPAKERGIQLLLEYAPSVSVDNVTMVHYKQDRPNSDAWQKDSLRVLKQLWEQEKGDSGYIDIESIVAENSKPIEIAETEKELVIKSRIGQSTFKKELLEIDQKCKLCGVSDERFLVASHIKPWRDSNNQERLDNNNGLLLCPNHDALFDKGYLSFDENGSILISDLLNEATRVFMNINENMKIKMNEHRRIYMKWHRENLFKK